MAVVAEPLSPQGLRERALRAVGLGKELNKLGQLNELSRSVPPESLTFDMELTSECATSPM